MEDMLERSSPAGEVEEFSSPIEDNIEPSSPAGESQDCPSPSHEIKAAGETQDCPFPSHEIKAAGESQDCPSPSHEIKAAGESQDCPSPSHEIKDAGESQDCPSPSHEIKAAGEIQDRPSPSHEIKAAGEIQDRPSPSHEIKAAGETQDRPSPSHEIKAAGESEDRPSPSHEIKAAGESQDCPSPSHEIKAAGESQDCPSPSQEIKDAGESQDCPSPSHEIKAADEIQDRPSPSHEIKAAGEIQDRPSPSHEIKAAGETQDRPSQSHEIKAAGETQDFPSQSHEIKAAGETQDIPSPADEIEVEDKMDISFFINPARETEARKQPGGLKTMPYILGTIALERLASIALATNLISLLIFELHMDPKSAINLISYWSTATNLARTVGGIISESVLGSRFRTITLALSASLVGMVIITLIPALPSLHPPSCTFQMVNQCMGPTALQLSILIGALALVTIGTGATRACCLSFGVDQVDQATEKRRGVYTNTSRYCSWYYTTCAFVMALAYSVMMYIQDKMSWVLGFAIPATLMLGSCILLLAGTRTYVFVRPDGSFFMEIAQVLLASYKKRHLQLPAKHQYKEKLYDPPTLRQSIATKLPLTNQLSFLNKAAIVSSGDVHPNGTRRSPWRLTSIQKVEEVKCVFKVLPVLVSGVLFSAVASQQDAFASSQMRKMDHQLGPNFKIPLGWPGGISMVTVMVFVPFYSRVLVPTLRKITKVESGVTLLQRMGIGLVLGILSVVVAGVVEKIRRESAISSARSDGMARISILWVIPQFILMGLAQGFTEIGQIGFYYNELPKNKRMVASSLVCFSSTGSSYISSLIGYVIRKYTRPDWLASDINQGRLDLHYYATAILGCLNLLYFLIVSRNYEYKVTDSEMGDKESEENGEV